MMFVMEPLPARREDAEPEKSVPGLEEVGLTEKERV
jgi:hypothetical protein